MQDTRGLGAGHETDTGPGAQDRCGLGTGGWGQGHETDVGPRSGGWGHETDAGPRAGGWGYEMDMGLGPETDTGPRPEMDTGPGPETDTGPGLGTRHKTAALVLAVRPHLCSEASCQNHSVAGSGKLYALLAKRQRDEVHGKDEVATSRTGRKHAGL